jgi:hypothetical protein
MTKQNPDFRQPPWVQSPSEVMNWIDATHPSKKTKGKKHVTSGKETLRNLHICFDLDVEQKKMPPRNIISKFTMMITKNGLVEEEFELAPTVELVLRGLAKAKFKNINKIIFDEKTIYRHSGKNPDLRKTIDDFGSITQNAQTGKSVEVTATLKEGMKSTAVIKIKKIHKERDHAVDIQIKGGIKKELYHTFLNYLTENLGLKGE